jgi:hypothetical protein
MIAFLPSETPSRRGKPPGSKVRPIVLCIACTVVPTADSWIVQCGADSHGPYLSNGMALRVATTEALALRRQGLRAKISVQNRAGDTCAEYCLCETLKKIRP